MSFVVSPPSLPEAPQVSVFGVREIDKCASLELQVCAHPTNAIDMHVFLYCVCHSVSSAAGVHVRVHVAAAV